MSNIAHSMYSSYNKGGGGTKCGGVRLGEFPRNLKAVMGEGEPNGKGGLEGGRGPSGPHKYFIGGKWADCESS